MAGRDLDLMILSCQPFGKLPHIAENSLVWPIQRYHRSHAAVRRNRGRRPQRAIQRQRLIILMITLNQEASSKTHCFAQSTYEPEHAARRCCLFKTHLSGRRDDPAVQPKMTYEQARRLMTTCLFITHFSNRELGLVMMRPDVTGRTSK